MAEKTMVEKAGEAAGFGIAMAEDVVGAIKTAVDVAVTTITGVLEKAPQAKAPLKQVGKIAPAKRAARKVSAAKAIKKPFNKAPARNSNAKKAAQKVAAKKPLVKKAVKKTVKKAGRRRK